MPAGWRAPRRIAFSTPSPAASEGAWVVDRKLFSRSKGLRQRAARIGDWKYLKTLACLIRDGDGWHGSSHAGAASA